MPRFFVEDIGGDRLTLAGEEARHIACSLRMKPGEQLVLCDGRGGEAICKLEEITPEAVFARVLERAPSKAETAQEITLYQALPKADKLELIVQKAVELGAAEIVPVLTARCISRPDEKAMGKKLARLQKIADEAAKQSGRGRLPKVAGVLSFRETVLKMSTAALPLFFFEHGDVPLSKMMESYSGGNIAMLVGAEGGFEPEEAAFAIEHGLAAVSLGPRILRCETAPIAAISAVLYATGNME